MATNFDITEILISLLVKPNKFVLKVIFFNITDVAVIECQRQCTFRGVSSIMGVALPDYITIVDKPYIKLKLYIEVTI